MTATGLQQGLFSNERRVGNAAQELWRSLADDDGADDDDDDGGGDALIFFNFL